MATIPAPPSSEEAKRPARLAWLVGATRAPALEPQEWRVLGLVSVATLFGQYDRAIFVLALPQIQDGLGIAEGQLGVLGAIVQLGALPAFGIALAADRFGRRRVLIASIVAYTLVTGLTMFAPDTRSFVALQFLAAALTQAESLVAIVVISETLPAAHRGWGIGALFAVQALGVGLAALLLPLVGLADDAWRVLYGLGLLPLLLLAWWRRGLPETKRFARLQSERVAGTPSAPAGQGGPLRSLVQAYPHRLALLCGAVFLLAASGAAADFFAVKYLQEANGWSPGDVTMLFLGGGALGLAGGITAGRLGDRLGRRRAAVLFSLALAVLALLFYQSPGPWVAPCWVLMVFALLGTDALFATYGAELFPTSHRTTAAGVRMLVATGAGVLGLATESLLYGWLGSHWSAISLLLCGLLLVPVVAAVGFPETAGRTLEEIAPERSCPRTLLEEESR